MSTATVTIQLKRGAAAGLPSLGVGEPGFTTDTFLVYVGSSGGNVLINPTPTDTSTIDFTLSGTTLTADVKANSIGVALMHASATDVLFGRSTAGAGAGEEIVCTATARSILDDTSTGAVLTTLGATTVGQAFFTLANPSAITFPRINADNSVSALDAASFRTAIGAGTGTGTVTSVALTVPAFLSVSGSPVTTSGTLAVTLASQASWKVFAGPFDGSSAAPTFRFLDVTDLPTHTHDYTQVDGITTARLLGRTTAGTGAAELITVGAGLSLSAGSLTAVGAALTKTDDTNVTLTLGGAPSTALVNAASITVGWTGTLAVARGGIGVGTLTAHGILLGQGTSAVTATAVMTDGQLLVGQSAADPLPKTITGDVTFTAAGVTAIGANKVTDAMLRQGTACTVIGRAANSTGNDADIALSADGKFLVRRSGVVQGDTFQTTDLPAINGWATSDAHIGDLVLNYDTGTSANKVLSVDRLGGFLDPGVCEGRLTLTSGTAVTTSDVTAAATIYFTPWKGNKVALYDGTRWRLYVLSEVSLALGTLVNGQAYDVFLFDSSGTLTLESVEWQNATVTMTIASPCVVTWTAHGLATGDVINFTTSGALPTGVTANTTYYVTKIDANTFNLSTTKANLAAGTFVNTSGSQSGTHTGHSPVARQTAITTQDGVYVKSGSTTKRYVGTFVTTATTTTEDSTTHRFVWNYYNRAFRPLLKSLSSAHTYTTAAWRQWNADESAQIEFVVGVREDTPLVALGGTSYGAAGYLAFGLDTTVSGSSPSIRSTATLSEAGQVRTWDSGIGYHYAAALEFGATTWHSDAVQIFGGLWC